MTSGTGIFHDFFTLRPSDGTTTRWAQTGRNGCNVGWRRSMHCIIYKSADDFQNPQTKVYEGMVVGMCAKENDLVVNVLKGKQLTNIRASGSDENIQLTPPIPLTLEYALSFINDDELVEITPESIRLRKRYLKAHERKRFDRSK